MTSSTTVRAIAFPLLFLVPSTLLAQFGNNVRTSLDDSWNRICRTDDASEVKRARICGVIEGAIGIVPPKFWENRLDLSMSFKERNYASPREANLLMVSSTMSVGYLAERSILQIFGDKKDLKRNISIKNDLLRQVQDENAMFFQEKYIIVKQKPGVMLLIELTQLSEVGFICPLKDFDGSIAGTSGPKPKAPEIGIVVYPSTCFVFIGKLGSSSIHMVDRTKGTVLDEIEFKQISDSINSPTDEEFGTR